MKKFKTTNLPRTPLLWFISWLVLPIINTSSLHALETDISVGAATEYSSNALRTDQNQGSETERSAILRFGLTENSSDISAHMNYSAERQYYVQEKFDKRTAIDGRADIEWRVMPRRLSLVIDHDIRDTTTDSSRPDTPDNRDKQAVTGIGAQLQANPSKVDNLSLLLRGSSVHFDKFSGNDNRRKQATLNWRHLLSSTRSVYLGSSYVDVDYKEADITDYEYQSIYIGFDTQLGKSSLALRIGDTIINREGEENIDGNTARLTWSQTPGTSPFQWSVYYGEELTDSSIGLIGDGMLPPDTGSDTNFEEIDILSIQLAGADFSYRFAPIRSQANLRLYWHDEDYEELLRDEKQKRVNLSFNRDFTRKFNAGFYLEYDNIEFLNDDTEHEDYTFGLRGSYALARQLNLSGDIYHLKRNHTFTENDFEDGVARLELMYTF